MYKNNIFLFVKNYFLHQHIKTIQKHKKNLNKIKILKNHITQFHPKKKIKKKQMTPYSFNFLGVDANIIPFIHGKQTYDQTFYIQIWQ
jgi:intergrase/recombinase